MIKLSSVPQFSRNAKRFKEILGVLLKYGLANWISKTDPEYVKNLFKGSKSEDQTKLSLEVRIRLALSELGTTFIKLGQVLSTRPDLVGPKLARELEQLQADAPSDSPQVVRELIEAELGQPIENLFLDFDPQPLGSASIGQVHQARTAEGPVVVKVQHRGIRKVIETDLEILSALAELAEKYNADIRLYQPKAVVAEFKRSLLKELDFQREANHLKMFRANFDGREMVRFPNPDPELSSRLVLTMERLDGVGIADSEQLADFDTEELARRAAAVFLDMIFRHGFYHADPHPGNIRILDNGVIGILDCGQVGRLDEVTLIKLEDMLLAAINQDIESLTDALCRLGQVPQDLDQDLLRADLDDFLAEYVGQAVDQLDVGSVLNSLIGIVHNHHIRLPANVSMVLKALVLLEGSTSRLDRNFNLMELLKPYSAEALRRRYSPGRMLGKLQRTYRDWDLLFGTLPNDLSSIIQLIRTGKFDVNLEHRRLDSIVNRMIYGLLTAALFMGSCLLLVGEIPPVVKGVSVAGFIGCLVSSFMGWRVLRAIHKSGFLK